MPKLYGYDDYIMHHGVKGQKWGVRNGPPYPLDEKTKSEIDNFNSKRKEVRSGMSNTPKPFVKQTIDISAVRDRGKLTASEAKQCSDLAAKIFSDAASREPQITDDILSVVGRTSAKMYGLEYRLKQPTSIAAKIGSDAKEDNLPFGDAANKISDAIRYTAISDTKDYTKNYFDIKGNLKDLGYSETRCKNNFQAYKEGKVLHKSVQSVFADKNGYKFEVQFQTVDSQVAKDLKVPIYEERRKSGLSDERKLELEKRMVDLAEKVSDPKDVLSIKSYK